MNNYYPFGMVMPGREYSAGNGYRYGFNGKEKDSDLNSSTAYDYGFRIYNPAIGKFLSVDPLTESFPYYTPYQFAGNDPIQNSDLDGAEQWAKNYVRWSLIQAWAQQSVRASKAQAPVEVSLTPPKPAIQPVHSEAAPQSIRHVRMAAMSKSSIPKTNSSPQSVSTTPYKSHWEIVESERQKTAIENNKKISAFAASYPESAQAAGMAYLTYEGAKTYVNGAKEHAVKAFEGFRDGNIGKGIGNTFLLGLEVAPFIPLKGVGAISSLPSRLARVIPEEFAGTSTLGRADVADVFVTDATELIGLNTSEEIAKKLTLKNADGTLMKGPFRIIEFDTPSAGLAQPFNRTNPGFVNGGKTAGGATEYVIPNVNINTLQNVTQKTIR